MALGYWVTDEGVHLADDNGNRLTLEGGVGNVPAPPPDWLSLTLQVRFIIGDPIGSSIVYVDTLPASALEDSVYTTGNGVYHKWGGGAWSVCRIALSDHTINSFRGVNVWESAKRAIALLLTRINPLDYITSGNAGGQSVSFPSLADVAAFYKAKQEAIEAQCIARGGAARVCVKPYPVGGVYG